MYDSVPREGEECDESHLHKHVEVRQTSVSLMKQISKFDRKKYKTKKITIN
jgi:hypothetical protein